MVSRRLIDRPRSSFGLAFGLIAMLSFAAPQLAIAQPIPGGNSGRYRTEAEAYRASLRTTIIELVGRLGDQWDRLNASETAQFYGKDATLILGPDRLIKGRKAIQDEFQRTLVLMHGVQFNVEEFDYSGDLVFVRGTMKYELSHGLEPSRKELATFSMTLRPRYDDWLITSHSIAGVPTLPPEKEQAIQQ
jgi:ketosteroid isomerase-like protein